MTNEEFTEEILFEAHTEGFIDELRTYINNLPIIILYIWDNSSLDWLFDKKHKSQHIIFNAEHQNELMTGYMAAQRNSSYFGILKNLAKVNTKAIYSIDDCIKLLETVIGTYEPQ